MAFEREHVAREQAETDRAAAVAVVDAVDQGRQFLAPVTVSRKQVGLVLRGGHQVAQNEVNSRMALGTDPSQLTFLVTSCSKRPKARSSIDCSLSSGKRCFNCRISFDAAASVSSKGTCIPVGRSSVAIRGFSNVAAPDEALLG
jgi:hypothetical protein